MCTFSRGVLPIGPDSVDASPSLPLTPSFSPPPSHLILISIFSTGSCRLCTPSPSLTPVSKRRKAHLRRLDRRWTLGGMVNRQHSRGDCGRPPLLPRSCCLCLTNASFFVLCCLPWPPDQLEVGKGVLLRNWGGTRGSSGWLMSWEWGSWDLGHDCEFPRNEESSQEGSAGGSLVL
jgi:hypothetical protein